MSKMEGFQNQISAINEEEKNSSGFKVNDRRLFATPNSIKDSETRVAELEQSIRKEEYANLSLAERNRMEIEKFFPKKNSDSDESEEYNVKNYVPDQSVDGGYREVDGYEEIMKARMEKDHAEAIEMNKAFNDEAEKSKGDRLQKESDEARKKFATADYEWDKKNRWFRKILGKKGQMSASDTRVEAFSEYKKKLSEQYTFQLEQIRNSGLNGDEVDAKIEELHKHFDSIEKTNIYEARTNARAEAWEKEHGKLPGMLMKFGGDAVNWYRKQNAWAKGAVGVALAASGLGFAAAGMRVMGGAAAGAGVTQALEARHRAKETKASSTERQRFMEEMKLKNLEEKLAQSANRLDVIIGEYRRDLKDEKRAAFIHRCTGAAVGVFIGSGAMSNFLKGSAHWVAETDAFKNVTHAIGESDVYKAAAGYVADAQFLKASYWEQKLNNIFASDLMAAEIPGEAGSVGGVVSGQHSKFPFSDRGIRDVGNVSSVGNDRLEAARNLFKELSDAAQEKAVYEPQLDLAREGMGGRMHDSLSEKNFLQESMSQKGININTEPVAVQSNVPEKISLEVMKGKGGSLEGTIIKHLKSSLNIDPKKAGAMAHRMALDYAKTHDLTNGPHNLIHPGAHIELVPDGNDGFKIADITDKKGLGYLPSEAHGADNKIVANNGGAVEKPIVEKQTASSQAPAEKVDSPAPKGVSSESNLKADAAGETETRNDLGTKETTGKASAGETATERTVKRPEIGRGDRAQSRLDRLHAQNEMVKSFAAKMGIEDRAHLKTVFRGGVPVEINGVKVPEDMLSAEQKTSVGVAEKVQTAMDRNLHQAERIGNNMGMGTPEAVSSQSFENFSQSMDVSAQELANIKNGIISHYGSEIRSDQDIFRKITELEEDMEINNTNTVSNTYDQLYKKAQLEELKKYRDSYRATYNKIYSSFFEAEKGNHTDAFDKNAIKYLSENKQSGMARIFNALGKIANPQEMNALQPKQDESVGVWSRRVTTFMLRRKLD